MDIIVTMAMKLLPLLTKVIFISNHNLLCSNFTRPDQERIGHILFFMYKKIAAVIVVRQNRGLSSELSRGVSAFHKKTLHI